MPKSVLNRESREDREQRERRERRSSSARPRADQARSTISRYFAAGSLALVGVSVALGLLGRDPGQLFQTRLVTTDPSTGRTVVQPRLVTDLTYVPGEQVVATFQNLPEHAVVIPVSCSVTLYAGDNIYIATLPTPSQCILNIPADGSGKLSATWDQNDMSAIPVPDGRYRIEAQVLVNGVTTVINSGRFRIKTPEMVAPTDGTTGTTTSTTPTRLDPYGNPIADPTSGQTQ